MLNIQGSKGVGNLMNNPTHVFLFAVLCIGCSSATNKGVPQAESAPAESAQAAPAESAQAELPDEITCEHAATRQEFSGALGCEGACQRENPCFETSDCMKTCQAGWTNWSREEQQAFFACALCDPLCHSRLEDCMHAPPPNHIVPRQ